MNSERLCADVNSSVQSFSDAVMMPEKCMMDKIPITKAVSVACRRNQLR